MSGTVKPAFTSQNILIAGGDVAAAVSQCQTALAIDPNNAEAHQTLGLVLCNVSVSINRPSPITKRRSPSGRSLLLLASVWATPIVISKRYEDAVRAV